MFYEITKRLVFSQIFLFVDCKDCDDGRYELAAQSKEEMNEWINMLNQARYMMNA